MDSYSDYSNRKRRVVIAGGGYAGTTCAVDLARSLRPEDNLEILLLALNPCQQALSELDLVAVGPPRPQFCELWHPTLFKQLPVTVCYKRLAEVRSKDHLIVIGEDEEISYWKLVIATGAVAFVPPIPGLRDHAITMWSVEDAQKLQQAIDKALKRAAKLKNKDHRSKVISFTVVGGGATGVEIMGTLARMLPKQLHRTGLPPEDLRLHLIEGRDEILFSLPPVLKKHAVRKLERLGVEIITGSFLERVEDGVAYLASGQKINSNVLVWAGGARPDPHATEWGLKASTSGRIPVNEYLKVPEKDDIYVIGDVAEVKNPQTKEPLPMLAQLAVQEGPSVANNILKEARGAALEQFYPKIKGEFVSIGPGWAVGQAYGIRFTGLPAIVMKRMTYIKYWFHVGGASLAFKRTREMLAMGR